MTISFQIRLRHWAVIAAIVGSVSDCAKAGRDTSNRVEETKKLCGDTHVSVDSTFAINQARRALGGVLTDDPELVPFRVEVVTHGMIVSLVSKRPTGTGGGGLVWIDRDNGGPIILRH